MVKPDVSLVCPTFAGSARDVGDFAEEFGTYQGRYVAQYPRDWVEAWHVGLNALLPVERQAASLYRADVQRALVRLPKNTTRFEPSKTWSDNAVAVARTRSIAHVVGDYQHPEPYRNWPAEIHAIRKNRPKPFAVGATVEEYAALTEHLIAVSPEAFVVDPYFDPLSDAGMLLLTCLIGVMRDSRCYDLHVILAKKRKEREMVVEPGAEFQNRLEGAFASVLQSSRSLLVHVVNDGNPHQRPFRLHDRYFLTRYGARFISRGFVLTGSSANPTENKVRNIPREEIPDLMAAYANGIAGARWQGVVDTYRVASSRHRDP